MVALVVYSLIRVIGSMVGGDEVAQGSPSDTSAAESTGTADPAQIDCSVADNASLCDDLGLGDEVTVPEGSGSPDGDGDVETSGPAVSAPERTGLPTAQDPARVYIVGDSDAGTFGPYLETLLNGTGVADTELNYKVSSGLARPDFFDWPAELAAKLPVVNPDIVVVTFGGNDSQGLSLPQPDLEFQVGDPLANEAEWTKEYERRVGVVMDLLLENDRRVVWVGIPNDDNAEITAKLEIQDRAAKAAAAERPGVVFVDTWARFSGRDGGWAEFVVDPRDQEGKAVRRDDGFHLNQTGAEILAIDIAIEVQKMLRDMGADI